MRWENAKMDKYRLFPISNRRQFIRQLSALGACSAMPQLLSSQPIKPPKKFIWAYLLHLSYNMWTDHSNVVWDDLPADYYSDVNFDIKNCTDARRWARGHRPFLTCDDTVWESVLQHMANVGMNMVVIDVGDGIKYESHPEIAVENAWSTTRLRNELSTIRKMGLEAIPKLNFATTHDAWLGEYSRMISTEKYYTVCRNLIREVCDLFDKPRFFHLGMDEESPSYQSQYLLVRVRQGELWWHDFYLLMEEVEKQNSRPWIWSDYVWHHPEEFLKKMPKTVLQSNWYYDTAFEPTILAVKYYHELEKHGYEQIPTASPHSNAVNFGLTVDYCKEIIDPSRLLGFLQTPWRPTLPACADYHVEAVKQVEEAIKKYPW